MKSGLGTGIALALLSALLFGITAPLLSRASVGVEPFLAAAPLYAGAALGALAMLVIKREASRLVTLARGRALGRLVLVALCGAVAAPALLVAGLHRTPATSAALALALEAPFTVVLARVVFAEHVGARVTAAMALITAGALALAFGPATALSNRDLGGLGLVAAATLFWALDNLLSRDLADVDPVAVVAGKGLVGAAVSVLVAICLHPGQPSAGRLAAIVGLGAVGYGASLQLYLRAQTLIGAARTASVFATAPLIGAIAALALGSPWPGGHFAVAGILMVTGVVVHAIERHDHIHSHEPLEHEHLHRHDDGHHTHSHDPMPAGPHTHPHRHEALTHTHPHSEDVHHRHSH